MTASHSYTIRFWLIVLAALVAILWLFRPVLLPFMFGLAIAYFLEPVVTALEKRKVPRFLGSSIALGGFLFAIVSLFLLVWPLLNSQFGALLDALPGYIKTVREQYLPWAHKWLGRFSAEDVAKIRDAAGQSTGAAVGFVSNTVKNIVSGGFAFVDAIALSILTPVTAFYVLRDWKKMTKAVDQMIPRKHYAIVREQLAEINQTLSGFMRGQAMVCIALGLIYSIGLGIAGLEYGVTVGLIAGVLSIMPYVGSTFGLVTSLLLAFVQFDGDWLRIGLVALVFGVGQFFEGYVLTPRFVGNRVGLHPVWILFALIAGIELMGFLGALIAVPTAAVIGVLIRFAARQYKTSAVYK